MTTTHTSPATQPVLVLQHLSADGPAYLGTWLQRRGQPFEVRNTQAAQAAPDDLRGYGALAILGGEMSANDDLPALRQAERLILQAMERGLPVIGHCLGGQLMARALGARVADSPAPEIGWQPLQMLSNPQARDWFGPAAQATVMQWHHEAFDLPQGAVALATSAACPHQAFAVGPHLALQFHIEIDAEKLRRWSADCGRRYRRALRQHPATVQTLEAMRDGIDACLAPHQALADRIYSRWLAGRTLP